MKHDFGNITSTYEVDNNDINNNAAGAEGVVAHPSHPHSGVGVVTSWESKWRHLPF